jgi:hypothetical protein
MVKLFAGCIVEINKARDLRSCSLSSLEFFRAKFSADSGEFGRAIMGRGEEGWDVRVTRSPLPPATEMRKKGGYSRMWCGGPMNRRCADVDEI